MCFFRWWPWDLFFLDVQGKKRTFSQKKDVGNNLAI